MGDPAGRTDIEGSPEDVEPPAPSRDDTRYPRSKRRHPWPLPGGGRFLRAAILGLLAAAFIAQRIATDSETGAPPDPVPVSSGLEITYEVRAYLDRVEEVCRTHDRAIARAGTAPVWEVARGEAAVTDRIASLEAPPDAREIRRRLLGARRMVDRTARWMARIMSESERPHHTYRQRVQPLVAKRVSRMYQTFGSFGVHCSTRGAPGSS